MTRETGEVRKRFFGNTEAAKAHMGQAMNLLGHVKNQMRLGGLKQFAQRFVLASGVVLFAQSVFGQDEVRIFAPEGGAAVKHTRREETLFPAGPLLFASAVVPGNVNEHLYAHTMTSYTAGATGFQTLYAGDADLNLMTGSTICVAGGRGSYAVSTQLATNRRLKFYDRSWNALRLYSAASDNDADRFLEVNYARGHYYVLVQVPAQRYEIRKFDEQGVLVQTYSLGPTSLTTRIPQAFIPDATGLWVASTGNTLQAQEMVRYAERSTGLEEVSAWTLTTGLNALTVTGVVATMALAEANGSLYLTRRRLGDSDVNLPRSEVIRFSPEGQRLASVLLGVYPDVVRGTAWAQGGLHVYFENHYGDQAAPGEFQLLRFSADLSEQEDVIDTPERAISYYLKPDGAPWVKIDEYEDDVLVRSWREDRDYINPVVVYD